MSLNPISSQVPSSNLGPKFFPMKHESFTVLNGMGIELNPYDLRDNVTVNMICRSDCGYPAVQHLINFRNSVRIPLICRRNCLSLVHFYHVLLMPQRLMANFVFSRISLWNSIRNRSPTKRTFATSTETHLPRKAYSRSIVWL